MRVLGFGLLQSRDVGVRILPRGKEILIGSARFGVVTLQGVGTAKAKMSQCVERTHGLHALMIENLLIFRDCIRALMRGTISFGPGVISPLVA